MTRMIAENLEPTVGPGPGRIGHGNCQWAARTDHSQFRHHLFWALGCPGPGPGPGRIGHAVTGTASARPDHLFKFWTLGTPRCPGPGSRLTVTGPPAGPGPGPGPAQWVWPEGRPGPGGGGAAAAAKPWNGKAEGPARQPGALHP